MPWSSLFRVALVCAIGATACAFDAQVPADAAIACSDSQPCPGALVCQRTLGRCLLPNNLDRDAPRVVARGRRGGVRLHGARGSLSTFVAPRSVASGLLFVAPQQDVAVRVALSEAIGSGASLVGRVGRLTESLQYEPKLGCPLGRVSALGPSSQARVAFAVDEVATAQLSPLPAGVLVQRVHDSATSFRGCSSSATVRSAARRREWRRNLRRFPNVAHPSPDDESSTSG